SFLFCHTATSFLSTLSLHDALPIYLLLSVCAILFTGIPLIMDTTSATLSSVTGSRCNLLSSSHPSWAAARSFSRRFSSSRSLARSEEHTSELQSRENLVCRLLLEKK